MRKIEVYRENDQIIFQPGRKFKISNKQKKFIFDVEQTVAVISEIYKNDKLAFEKYLVQLIELAQFGLSNKKSHLKVGEESLSQIQEEIVRNESSKIKNQHITKIGNTAFFYYILPSIFLFSIFYVIQFSTLKSTFDADASKWKNVFLLISSSSIGLWISVTISKTKLEFSDLITLESNELSPHLRLIFTNLISLVFLIMFIEGVIVIKFGPISSSKILDNGLIAIIFGTILGLNERLLGSSLIKRTSGIIK